MGRGRAGTAGFDAFCLTTRVPELLDSEELLFLADSASFAFVGFWSDSDDFGGFRVGISPNAD